MSMLGIIIPYHKINFFDETLKSLANQTNKNFKVYIGDDASPNNPLELLKQYEGAFSFTYHRFKENLGSKSLVKQWNRCLKMVKSEDWIQILGDDDCLSEHFVEYFYKTLPNLKAQNSKLLRFATLRIDKNSKPLGTIQYNPEIQSPYDAFAEKYYGTKHSSLSEYIFSIASYLKYGFRDYPLAWCSDDMAWLEFTDGQNIVSCNNAYLKFRLSSKSISGTLNPLKKEAKLVFFKDIVFDKQASFSRDVAIKNLKKYEVFIVMNNKLRRKHFVFFIKHFFKLRSVLECLKFMIRFNINIFKLK